MHHWPWRAVIIGAVATALIYSASRPDPEMNGLMLAGPEELIARLKSSRDAVRRSAAGRLMGLGAPAISSLVLAAESADDQQLDEIFLVLEDMYLSPDDTVADAAEQAVERLMNDSPREEVKRGAKDLLQSNFVRRQLRAYEKVESYSGKLVTSPATERSGEPAAPDLVVIGSDWTGGDEGLKYVRQLRGVAMVHLATDAPISPQAVQRLKYAVAVRRDTDCCLGVDFLQARGGRLFVSWVWPGSPADWSGLSTHDEIRTLNGQPISDFFDFAGILRNLRPGDTVTADVIRDGRSLLITIELGTDFGTGRCLCADGSDRVVSALEALPIRLPGRRGLPVADRLDRPTMHGRAHAAHRAPHEIPRSGR